MMEAASTECPPCGQYCALCLVTGNLDGRLSPVVRWLALSFGGGAAEESEYLGQGYRASEGQSCSLYLVWLQSTGTKPQVLLPTLEEAVPTST